MVSGAANAEEFQVKMLTAGKSGSMVFEPSSLKIKVRDTIKFLPTNPGHNATFVKGMFPAGVTQFQSGFNKEASVTFTQSGVYGVQCTPHLPAGMVMLVVVDQPTNLTEARAVKLPPIAQKRITAFFQELIP
jgi:pseudoazurin